MLPLISVSDIRAVRDLSNQIKDNKINPLISDAEMSDLRPLLGDSFFFAIKKNPENYTNLLDPLEYTINDEINYHFGLKRLLCELSYVRYMFDSGDISTPFGVIEKNFTDGVRTSRDRTKELSNLRKQTANEYWLGIEKYLINNAELYPLFKITGNSIETFKFTHITR
jgi:hypothetical protein